MRWSDMEDDATDFLSPVGLLQQLNALLEQDGTRVVNSEEVSRIEATLSQIRGVAANCILHLTGKGQQEMSVLPAGAYRFGVLRPGDSVDAFLLGPRELDARFLQAALIEELSDCQAAAVVVGEVPALTCILRGVKLRLLLGSADGKCAARQACEAEAEILKRMPDGAAFRRLLRVMKHWAQQQGVYGEAQGFLGGAAWTVCCARACQQCPDGEVDELVFRLFDMLGKWNLRQPVSVLGLPVAGHSSHNLCVSTSYGSTTCSATTTGVLLEELKCGLQQVLQARAGLPGPTFWDKKSFLTDEEHFLALKFTAASPLLLESWVAFCETKLHLVVRHFEDAGFMGLRPWPQILDVADSAWPEAKAVFFGLRLNTADKPAPTFDFRAPVVSILDDLSAWPEAPAEGGFNVAVRHLDQSGVQSWLSHSHASF